MVVRAIRGAIQVERDDPDEVLAATRELLTEVVRRNEITPADLISIVFTLTPDLTSCFPAVAARDLGFVDDARRLNVAWTRPKVGLVIVGDPRTLRHCPLWARALDHCREVVIPPPDPPENGRD